jgi:hypothetical protein
VSYRERLVRVAESRLARDEALPVDLQAALLAEGIDVESLSAAPINDTSED